MSNTVHDGDRVSSFLGSGLHIEGNVVSDGEIVIEATIVGDVKGRIVTLGATGEVRGEIIADQVQVSGAVAGQVRARAVNLSQTARVDGDIMHEVLSVDAGAHIDGAVRHVTTDDLKQKTQPTKVKSRAPEAKGAAACAKASAEAEVAAAPAG